MADYHKIIKLHPIIDVDLLRLEKNYDVSLQKLITGAIEMELMHDNRQFRMPTVKRETPGRDDLQRVVYLSMNDPEQIEYLCSIAKGLQTLYIKTILRKHLSQYLEYIAFGKYTEDPTVTYVDMPRSGRTGLARKTVKQGRKPPFSNIQTQDSVQTTFEKLLENNDEHKKPELHVTELKDYFDERNKAILGKGKTEEKTEKAPIEKENPVDKEIEKPSILETTPEPAEAKTPETDLTTTNESTASVKEETPNLMKWLDGVY